MDLKIDSKGLIPILKTRCSSEPELAKVLMMEEKIKITYPLFR